MEIFIIPPQLARCAVTIPSELAHLFSWVGEDYEGFFGIEQRQDEIIISMGHCGFEISERIKKSLKDLLMWECISPPTKVNIEKTLKDYEEFKWLCGRGDPQ